MKHGEKIVLRILDQKKAVLPLDKLGFSERNLRVYKEKIRSPWGMILHVGPTGSGKSMSLYSAVNELLRPEINIQTIEDPIEYSLPSINQLQVHPEIGLTFQRALRAFLRQDPDVILVGEIRDSETAQTAIEASLTGHLLFSTLHTNDAASTMIRFIKMGIEPFMVSASVLVICAQRLLRRLCNQCKTPYHPDEHEKNLIGVEPNAEIVIYRPSGCEACDGDGYNGRVGVYELLAPDDALHTLMNRKGVTAEEIKRAAVKTCGMTTLYWDAMEKVRAGMSSLEDALLNVQQDEFDSRPFWAAQPARKTPHRRPKTTLRR
jgi:type IV pilus assembly protein PilB